MGPASGLQSELDIATLRLSKTEASLVRAQAQLEGMSRAYAQQRSRAGDTAALLAALLRWGAFVRTARRLRHMEQQAAVWCVQHKLKRR